MKKETKFKRYILIFLFLLIINACTERRDKPSSEFIIRISVKNQITVNDELVPIDSLEAKLAEIGITKKTNIRIMPDPEAGAATVEMVQRKVRIFKQSS